jgi:DNA-directed RNA polymerase subunit N (RpoN/RPB10)
MNRCLDCGKIHETWGASSICCEPRNDNKRSAADGRCTICDRFTPAGFGCHGKFIADTYAAIKKRANGRSERKQKLIDDLKAFRRVKSDRIITKLSRNEQKARRTTFIEMI